MYVHHPAYVVWIATKFRKRNALSCATKAKVPLHSTLSGLSELQRNVESATLYLATKAKVPLHSTLLKAHHSVLRDESQGSAALYSLWSN
jgi:hypothetical protein